MYIQKFNIRNFFLDKDILLALFSCMMIFVETMNFAGFTWIS